jgi:hypothetical protein
MCVKKKAMGGIMNYFKSSIFFSRLAFSIFALFITVAPFWIFIYFVILNLVDKNEKISHLLWCWSAYLASVIIIVMIIGWIVNVKPNLFFKVIVITGTCCAIPHVVISFINLSGIVILPLDILACYLVYWYLKGWQPYVSEPKPALKMKIKLG